MNVPSFREFVEKAEGFWVKPRKCYLYLMFGCGEGGGRIGVGVDGKYRDYRAV